MSDKIRFGGMKRQGCGILVCFICNERDADTLHVSACDARLEGASGGC